MAFSQKHCGKFMLIWHWMIFNVAAPDRISTNQLLSTEISFTIDIGLIFDTYSVFMPLHSSSWSSATSFTVQPKQRSTLLVQISLPFFWNVKKLTSHQFTLLVVLSGSVLERFISTIQYLLLWFIYYLFMARTLTSKLQNCKLSQNDRASHLIHSQNTLILSKWLIFKCYL